MDLRVPQVFSYVRKKHLHLLAFPSKNLRKQPERESLEAIFDLDKVPGTDGFLGNHELKGLCHQFWPVGNGGGQIACMNDIELLTEGPGFFTIIDFEFYVRRHPMPALQLRMVFIKAAEFSLPGWLSRAKISPQYVGVRVLVPCRTYKCKDSGFCIVKGTVPYSMAHIPVPVPTSSTLPGF
ncbi:MAG: hypothetical protein Q9192_001560 [Flavoplaca navasiana]